MPNTLETSWMTLEVNDVSLSLCNDLGRPNLGKILFLFIYLFIFLKCVLLTCTQNQFLIVIPAQEK